MTRVLLTIHWVTLFHHYPKCLLKNSIAHLKYHKLRLVIQENTHVLQGLEKKIEKNHQKISVLIVCTTLKSFTLVSFILSANVDQQLIVPPSSYTGLTLGDNVNILCTSQQFKESEATVNWIDPNNYTLHNPLMLSPVSVRHNNTRYTCFISIHQNPNSCIPQNHTIEITIKGNE